VPTGRKRYLEKSREGIGRVYEIAGPKRNDRMS
jgi:hypothetical protein